MYSNISKSVRDSVCFFMDEEEGHKVGFLQFPQTFENLTKNDVYSSSPNATKEVSINEKLVVISKLIFLIKEDFNGISTCDVLNNKGRASWT